MVSDHCHHGIGIPIASVHSSGAVIEPQLVDDPILSHQLLNVVEDVGFVGSSGGVGIRRIFIKLAVGHDGWLG